MARLAMHFGLWDAGELTSFAAVVELLETRYGQRNRAEQYRVELKARRRKPGENLQGLYQEICRLVALAYPGEHSSSQLSALIARDAFLDALNDRDLYVRVLEREPQTIEQALSIACKLEAIYSSFDSDNSCSGAGNRESNTLHVRTVAQCDEPMVGKLLEQFMEQSKLLVEQNKIMCEQSQTIADCMKRMCDLEMQLIQLQQQVNKQTIVAPQITEPNVSQRKSNKKFRRNAGPKNTNQQNSAGFTPICNNAETQQVVPTVSEYDLIGRDNTHRPTGAAMRLSCDDTPVKRRSNGWFAKRKRNNHSRCQVTIGVSTHRVNDQTESRPPVIYNVETDSVGKNRSSCVSNAQLLESTEKVCDFVELQQSRAAAPRDFDCNDKLFDGSRPRDSPR